MVENLHYGRLVVSWGSCYLIYNFHNMLKIILNCLHGGGKYLWSWEEWATLLCCGRAFLLRFFTAGSNVILVLVAAFSPLSAHDDCPENGADLLASSLTVCSFCVPVQHAPIHTSPGLLKQAISAMHYCPNTTKENMELGFFSLSLSGFSAC